MRKLISPEEALRRLRVIFPRVAFDAALSSPMAGWAVAVHIYVDAVCSPNDATGVVWWARPTTALWMSESGLAHSTDDERALWRKAAARGSKYVEDLHEQWSEPTQRRYKENSRESLRKAYDAWHEYNAIRKRTGFSDQDGSGNWSLFDHFANLFDPDISHADFDTAATAWRDQYLDPDARKKAEFVREMERAQHAVKVTPPNNPSKTITLAPGVTSLIIKNVVENWATSRLQNPVLVAISERRNDRKAHLGLETDLRALGLSIDPDNVPPTIIMADNGVSPTQFWIIEAGSVDRVVSERRRSVLLDWAASQNIDTNSCSFLTAFTTRNSPEVKRRLKDLASGTWAWFAAEPDHDLAWYPLHPSKTISG